jgi:hypothetical protein
MIARKLWQQNTSDARPGIVSPVHGIKSDKNHSMALLKEPEYVKIKTKGKNHPSTPPG